MNDKKTEEEIGLVYSFIENGITNFRDKWVKEQLWPNTKNLIYGFAIDAVNSLNRSVVNGVNLFFDQKMDSNFSSAAGYTNHNAMLKNASVRPGNACVQTGPKKIDFSMTPSDVKFATKSEAIDVLYRMQKDISNYGVVGLDRFYQLAKYDISNADYPIALHGWISLDGARVVPASDGNGFNLLLPRFTKVR